MKKRYLSLLVILTMLFTCIPYGVIADDEAVDTVVENTEAVAEVPPAEAQEEEAPAQPAEKPAQSSVKVTPEAVTAEVGEQVTFTVSKKGTTYAWTMRKSENDEWVQIKNAKKASLTITVTEEMNGYQFRCVVITASAQSQSSEVSDPATLTVVSKAAEEIPAAEEPAAEEPAAEEPAAEEPAAEQAEPSEPAAEEKPAEAEPAPAATEEKPAAEDTKEAKEEVPAVSPKAVPQYALNGESVRLSAVLDTLRSQGYAVPKLKRSSYAIVKPAGLVKVLNIFVDINLTPVTAFDQATLIVDGIEIILTNPAAVTEPEEEPETAEPEVTEEPEAEEPEAEEPEAEEPEAEEPEAEEPEAEEPEAEETEAEEPEAEEPEAEEEAAASDEPAAEAQEGEEDEEFDFVEVYPRSAAITVTAEPDDVGALAGTKFTMKVTASGSNLTYAWQYKVPGGTSWAKPGAATYKKAALTLTAEEAMNGRLYRCVISDDKGNTTSSREAELSIVKILITEQPENAEVAAGMKFTMSVKASGNNLTYAWQYKNPTDSNWSKPGGATYKKASLMLTADEAWDGRIYRCVITDDEGNKTTSNLAILTIAPIGITTQPADASAGVGQKFTMKVVAVGSNLTYAWQYKNAGSSAWATPGNSLYKKATLTLTAEEGWDGRVYRCVVRDDLGNKKTSNEATLTIPPIVITKQPTDVTAYDGTNFTMRVVALGSNLTYAWQYLNPGTTAWATPGNAAYKKADLTLTAEAAWNGRKFRCVIRDDQGHKVTSEEATLTVPPQPIKITVQPVDTEAVRGTQFTVSVKATSTIGSTLTYAWQYLNPDSTAWATPGNAAFKKADLTQKADDIWDGRKLRCYIKDAEGNKQYTEEILVTLVTPPIEITSQPADAEAPVGTKFTISVTANSTKGSTLTYAWQYKNPDSTAWATPGNAAYKKAALTLTAEDTWDGRKFRCIIKDALGNKETSDEATLTVLPVDENFVYEKAADGQSYIVVEYKKSDAAVLVPSTFNNLPVSAIADNAFSGKSVVVYWQTSANTCQIYKYTGSASTLTIPTAYSGKTVTRVGDSAFENKTSLTSISLPNTIESIGKRAFKGCTNLSSMNTHD